MIADCAIYYILAFMPTLTIQSEQGTQRIPLQGMVSIGRHPKNTICIDESEISKQHACIQEVDGKYIYKDLNSSNGSYFNEIRIQEHIFKNGDCIRVGHTQLSFHAETSILKDINKLVTFEQFDGSETTDFQEKIEISALENFQPESEIHDAKLLRIDYEKLRLGQVLLQHIGLERDIDKLLNIIAKHLTPMFSADRCVILLLNKTGVLEVKAVFTLEALDAPIIVSQSVLKEVQQSKSAVLLSNTEKEDEIAQVSSLKLMGISSVMCAPIIHDNEVLGAIHLDLSTGQGAFTKKDLQLLGGISNYIAMSVANVGLTKSIEREVKLQAQFERLLSPSIVKQLVSGKLNIGQAGELREVTIMFVDIRGFTRMSHKTSPKDVVSLLNEYFERVVEIIFKYGGTVDKFMGDAVMVLFGAPLSMKLQADAAAFCALEIQAMLSIWNKARVKNKQGLIPVGIGMNSGEVVVGAIGSSKTMQYTVVGNAVNVASRLTSIAKAGQIIASHQTMKQLKTKVNFKALPPQNIKGIADRVQTYEVISLST